MIVKGTYLQNDKESPIKYGDVSIHNSERRILRGQPLKKGIVAETVMNGFCGTDYELMKMGRNGELAPKFPEQEDRLVNGHEGVVWVPEQNRFAIVLIRGGNSYDPTRYTEEETYFEYGCDKADGLFSDCNYYHPDMLLKIPTSQIEGNKIPLSLAKRLVFSDPLACMLFQLERMEDLGEAHNFRVIMAREQCDEVTAREIAKKEVFKRVVIFGLGTTGMLMGDVIRQKYKEAQIVYVARSEESSKKVSYATKKAKALYVKNNYERQEDLANQIIMTLGGKATTFIGVSGINLEHDIAFKQGVLGCNGIYNSFSLGPKLEIDSMPFGFQNHLIFSSINFRKCHMEKAIEMLVNSDYDTIVELIDKEEFIADPLDCYENKIYSKAAPLKTAMVWNDNYIDYTK